MSPTLITTLGLGLVHSLWQGALVIAIAGPLLALAGNRSRVRYLILSLALATLVTLPIATVVIAVGDPVTAIAEEPGVTQAPIAALGADPAAPRSADGGASRRSARIDGWVARWIDRGLPLLVVGWLIGVAAGLVRIAGAWVVLRRMIARATPASAMMADRAASLAAQLGLTRAVRILVSAEVLVPCAAGLLRPVVLLPAAVLSGLSPFQLDLILTHELAHIRRWDYLVNLLQTVAETLLFYHPAAWWLSRRIRIEREYCCDDLVVGVVADPVRYARALVDLEALRAEAPELAAGWAAGSLGDRIERLVSRAAPRPTLGWLPVTVTLLCLAAVARVGAAPATTAEPAVAEAAADGDVLRHPDPSAPLAERWTWAFAEARRRGWREVTIGWGIQSTISDRDIVVSSTRGGSAQDRGAVVGPLLGEPNGTGVAVFLSFGDPDAARLEAVALRSMAARYSPRGVPIVWLGGAPDRASIGMLERIMTTADPGERSELGAAITLHDDPALVLAASRRIVRDDQSNAVRAELISWLPRQLPNPAIRSLLLAGLEDPSPLVRDEALSALRGDPDRGALLLDAIARSPYPDVRSEAIQALDGGDQVSPGALVRALRSALDDPDAEVRREAGDALIKLGQPAVKRRGEI